MHDLMYDHGSTLIVGLLLVLLLVALEAGFRLGRRVSRQVPDTVRNQIGAIQASLLGVLALLLGFTFSLSLQRYDARSIAVVEEANAIGTALLRTDLLPEAVREQTREALRAYLALRVDSARISLDHARERAAAAARTERAISGLWALAVAAVRTDPGAVTSGLYVQALNQAIDAYGLRQAALERHVPEAVMLLMFIAFVVTACLVGYTSGTAGNRVSLANLALIVLVVLLVFVIIDLDRPRRGLIEVPQDSMHALLHATVPPARGPD